MNIDELKKSWDEYNKAGLSTHGDNEILKIVHSGISGTKSDINKKLFKDIVITAISAVVSAFFTIFFYIYYDIAKHSHVNFALVAAIQNLAFVIFFILLLYSLMEYKMLNRKYDPENIKEFLEKTIRGFNRNFRAFGIIILVLLFSVFILQLKFLILPLEFNSYGIVVGIAAILTGLSFYVIKWYYYKNYERYLNDMRSYLNYLKN
ncbi:MAG: hypothetical protein M3512_16325 [Bacteroidota bacterium]|nr:hypothetical protein [Bacteroidota bacterium]